MGEYEKKRKRRESGNVHILCFGGGKVKRVKLSQQLKDVKGDVKELSGRVETLKKACLTLRTAYHLFRRS